MIPETLRLPNNPALKGQAQVISHIVYSENGQHLTLILPWAKDDLHSSRQSAPLILFVQGSAWTTPNLGKQIPMLSHFAEEGYAVATISHRSVVEGHPFPAFLVDAKCALRYLRAHAAEYGIDPRRVTAFGTSSGGNTVCLMGLTGDDPAFKSHEYAGESDAVTNVVACFAPTHLPELFEYLKDSREVGEILSAYSGSPDPDAWQRTLQAHSPALLVKDGVDYPPFLLLHGTGDTLVPVSQMDILYTRLIQAGVQAKAYYVEGAEHEADFWSPQVRSAIHDEIVQRLAE